MHSSSFFFLGFPLSLGCGGSSDFLILWILCMWGIFNMYKASGILKHSICFWLLNLWFCFKIQIIAVRYAIMLYKSKLISFSMCIWKSVIWHIWLHASVLLCCVLDFLVWCFIQEHIVTAADISIPSLPLYTHMHSHKNTHKLRLNLPQYQSTLTWRHIWGLEVNIHHTFLTLAQEGKWLASHPSHFTFVEDTSSTSSDWRHIGYVCVCVFVYDSKEKNICFY